MLKSLNKIFNGLSAQYADDYLSASDKDRILSNRPLYQAKSGKIIKAETISHGSQKHIALLCSDSTNESVLSYVLGNSNDCSVDVLFHGLHKSSESESFYKHARSSFVENHIDVRLVKLINDSVSDIKSYLMNHRGLQYLVTDSHDLLINEFLNNKNIQRQVDVPIVLIN